MTFYKFTIASEKDAQNVDDTNEVILINKKHIVSLKPINILTDAGIVEGYWIRVSNGKKYRAVSIPQELKDLLA